MHVTALRHTEALGLLARVTNLVTGLDIGLGQPAGQSERIRADIATARSILERPFDQTGHVAQLKARQAEIEEALSTADADSRPGAGPAITYPPVGATPQDCALFLSLHPHDASLNYQEPPRPPPGPARTDQPVR